MQRNNKYKEVDKTMKGNVLMSEEKVKIIPLGGLGEIGKNITAFECDDEIIVIDCGISFPDEEMYGVDLIIPDIWYLKNNIKENLKEYLYTKTKRNPMILPIIMEV